MKLSTILFPENSATLTIISFILLNFLTDGSGGVLGELLDKGTKSTNELIPTNSQPNLFTQLFTNFTHLMSHTTKESKNVPTQFLERIKISSKTRRRKEEETLEKWLSSFLSKSTARTFIAPLVFAVPMMIAETAIIAGMGVFAPLFFVGMPLLPLILAPAGLLLAIALIIYI